MSAELLREAARMMRARAELARPGPWHMGSAVDPTTPCNIHSAQAATGVADNVHWLDAEHIIAFGSPAVALAVADWIEDEAIHIDDTPYLVDADWIERNYRAPIAVARAYLGVER